MANRLGHIYATVIIRGTKDERTLKNVVVDTGATFTVMPEEIIEGIAAIKSPWTIKLKLGNNRKVTATVYLAEIEVDGRKGPVRVAAFKGAVPAIGVDTLETLG